MRRTGIFASLLLGVGLLVFGAATVDLSAGDSHERGKREVVLRDDCDPRDPAWAPTGGCSLEEGDVNFAEFQANLVSPLVPSVVGHLAWWFDPNYLEIQSGKRLRVKNAGGRIHTFTEVAQFGGGRVPPLNGVGPGALTPAPECVRPGVVDLPGGARDVVDGLEAGNHRFQCCIHPWMRTLVKVSEHKHHDDR